MPIEDRGPLGALTKPTSILRTNLINVLLLLGLAVTKFCRSVECCSSALTEAARNEGAEIGNGARGRQGEAWAAARLDAVQRVNGHPHFRALEGHRCAVDDRRMPDPNPPFPRQEQAGQHPRRRNHVGALLDQRPRAFNEAGEHALEGGLIAGEGGVEILWRDVESPDAGETIAEAVALRLLVMPDFEDPVDGDETDPAAKLSREMKRRLAHADDRDAYRRSRLIQAGVLEMAHDKGVIALRFSRDRGIDRLDCATKLR